MASHGWPGVDGIQANHQITHDLHNHFSQLNPVYGLQRSSDLFNPFIANAAVLQQKV